jgi:hypothetical protein
LVITQRRKRSICHGYGLAGFHISHRYRYGSETSYTRLISVPVRLRAHAARIVYDGFVSIRNGADMAQKVQTLFVDDLDGSAAEGTVRFGLDGTDYEIDLNTEHAQALRDALARYVSAGRRAAGGTRRPARSGRKASANGVNATEVREWAKEQGIDVKDRGRVPAELVVKFKAAAGN